MPATACALAPAALALLAAWQHAPWAAAICLLALLLLLMRALGDCAAASTCLLGVLDRYGKFIQVASTVQAALLPPSSSHSDPRSESNALPASPAAAPIDDEDEIVGIAAVAGGEQP